MNDQFSNTDYFHNTFGTENIVQKNNTFKQNITNNIKKKYNTPKNQTIAAITVLLGTLIAAPIAITMEIQRTHHEIQARTAHIQQERFTVNHFVVDGPSTTVHKNNRCNRLIADIVDPAHPLNKLPGNDIKDIPQTYQKVSGYLNNENTPKTIYINREKPFDAKDSIYIENYSVTHSNEGNEHQDCELNAE